MENQPVNKKWYTKKIFLIPIAVAGLFGLGNIDNSTPQGVLHNSVVVPVVQQAQITPSSISVKAKEEIPQKDTTKSPTIPSPSENLSNNNYYTNTAGNEVHSPAYSNSVPIGASAECRDGTYSFSQSHRGTCSHHGGVSTWLR